MSYYDPTRKQMKRYYRRLYFTLLEMCLLNAWIIYIQICDEDKYLNYLDFKLRYVEETMVRYGNKNKSSPNPNPLPAAPVLTAEQARVKIPDEHLRDPARDYLSKQLKPRKVHYKDDIPYRTLVADHMVIQVPGQRQECKFCRDQSILINFNTNKVTERLGKTSFRCRLCNIPIHPNCFSPYHKIQDYKNSNLHQVKVILITYITVIFINLNFFLHCILL